VIVAVPGDTPVKVPGASIVAIVVLLLLHKPPVTASLSVMESSMHTWAVPPIADGVSLTVTIVLTEQPPCVYVIVSTPADTPVTTPPETPAILVVILLQAPPVVASAKMVVAPIHKLVTPVIPKGEAFTVIIFVTVQPVEPNE